MARNSSRTAILGGFLFDNSPFYCKLLKDTFWRNDMAIDWDAVKEFYDNSYIVDMHRLNMRPDLAIEFALEYLTPCKTLDIGCGFGRNALPLARRGFLIKGIDISHVATEHLKKTVLNEHLPVEVVNGNIVNELLDDDYGLIVNSTMLQNFDQELAHWLIGRMKEKTVPGGVNIIVAWGPGDLADNAHAKEVPGQYHYFSEQELKELYKDWEPIGFQEQYIGIGLLKGNILYHLVARKPR
jgi:tellurite methyltransferase